MLETIKEFISELDDIPFNRYFVAYMIRVQDSNIENEVKSLMNKSTLNIYVLDKVLENSYKGLVAT